MYPNPLIYCTCWDPWNLGPRKLIKTPQPPSKTSSVKPKMKVHLGKQEESNKLPNEVINVSPGYRLVRNREQISVTLGDEMFDRKKHSESEDMGKVKISSESPNYPYLLLASLPKRAVSELNNLTAKFPSPSPPSASAPLPHDDGGSAEHSLALTGPEPVMLRESPGWHSLEALWVMGYLSHRIDIIADLKEQISELTVIIEQMNRDHRSAQKLLSNEMDLRCAEMQKNFESKTRELEEAHAAQLSELEKNYKAALKAEKLAAQDKLEEMGKEYKYLKNMFHIYQDSIYDEMEDKWSKKKAEWEKDEKLERERILLQQKHRITRKFELESEEERKKINESYTAIFENFSQEKEELLKQHERDTLQLEELRKTKEVIEEELYAQALILESLNTTLYQTQMELQREKAAVATLEKTLQIKLTEAEDKLKYTIHHLTEENIHLRQKILAKNEEIYDEQFGRSTSVTIYEHISDTSEDGDSETQEA
ncbi:hypothetical protein MJT46_004098 [Ovis ammon polii x Ovis aries]|nr:hypothetical protein MJT46_004098 [Ovis ammon polii x Ovis aries]